MKLVLAAAAAFACLAPGAAFAQTTPPAAAAPAQAAAKFSLDTPIEVLVADPRAKAVLDAGLGIDVTTHPAYGNFKAMSLRQVQPASNGQVTDAMMATIEKGLAELK